MSDNKEKKTYKETDPVRIQIVGMKGETASYTLYPGCEIRNLYDGVAEVPYSLAVKAQEILNGKSKDAEGKLVNYVYIEGINDEFVPPAERKTKQADTRKELADELQLVKTALMEEKATNRILREQLESQDSSGQIADLQAQVTEKDAALEAGKAEIERLTSELEAQRKVGENVTELQGRVTELQAQIAEKDTALEGANARIVELESGSQVAEESSSTKKDKK